MDVNKSNSSPKPLIYFDQNVYDRIRRGTVVLPESFKDEFDVAYSSQILEEISRSGNLQDVYLDILESLNPTYLDLILNDKFKATDRVRLIRGPAREIFQWWNESRSEAPQFQSMTKFAHKLFGGRKDMTINALVEEQRSEFSILMKNMLTFTDEKNREEAERQAARLTQEFSIISETMRERLNADFNNPESSAGVRAVRKALGTSPKELHNISPPNVIQKIWKVLISRQEFVQAGVGLERFFGIEESAINPGEKLVLYEKVLAMYHTLNSIGYHQDRDIEADNRFTSVMNDSFHASNAIFCKALLTFDKHFSKKCVAIYEHLNIGTQVVYPQASTRL